MTQVTVFDAADRSMVIGKGKNARSVSTALGMVYASKVARSEESMAMYANWLQHGMYRPILKDVLASGLLPTASLDLFQYRINSAPKLDKVFFCAFVLEVAHFANTRTTKDGSPKVYKGKAAFVLGLLNAICAELREPAGKPVDTVDQEPASKIRAA